ncbi:tetratricopeptide repeat protein [Jannaschia sp. M317]|uniref:tetratricopeptide repeat protein n=1 Tax=Jannaschia sp. M317 TaxID=2867011 RepID=UPI0021A87A2E|nr:tetratricopeptide repeat protein [Jannaschia sp. M317]UWQ17536.1 tetratricopeptide repeat protein [Jannaschia sp. M317]
MMRRVGILCVAALMVAGCNPGLVQRGAHASDPLAAPGPARGAGGVDPLIVGDRLLEAGEAELALSSYLRGAADAGLTPEIQLSLAAANIQLGRLHQAERLLRDVLDAEPQNARAMNNLGVVLLELGELGEAHRVFRAAFALQPTPEIRENLRVSGAKLENLSYGDPIEDDAFTLTRRANGVYGLHAPG